MSPIDKALANTEALLSRAAEIDPAAWAAPMPRRMQARRDRSYAQAVSEFKASCSDAPSVWPTPEQFWSV